MYVVVRHEIKDRETAFARGEQLIRGDGAPAAVRVLQFLPSCDGSTVTCLWEGDSVENVQGYVDATLGESARNVSYEVDARHGFADRPLGLAPSPRSARRDALAHDQPVSPSP